MMYGSGKARTFGRGGGGWGFGFRGASPPWPYIGRGRGGLPRCGYFLSGAAGTFAPWYYQQTPFTPTQANPWYYPYTGTMTKEEELNYLKDEAEAIKRELERIDARIRDLEAGN